MAQKIICPYCGAEYGKVAVTPYSLVEYECKFCGRMGQTCEDVWDDCPTTKERVRKLFANHDDEDLEAIWETFAKQIATDQEPTNLVIYYLLKAFLNNSVDDALLAMCGWSLDTLINMTTLEWDDDEEEGEVE